MRGDEGRSETLDAVVVGGGIAGLACAERLHRDGASVRLLEASPDVGGKLTSVEAPGGFRLEAGPHEVRSGDPAMFRQFEELGIEGDRVRAREAVKKRYVVTGGRPVAIPGSPLGAVGTDLLSLRGKLRMLAEPLVRGGEGEDESVAAFFRRRLGREVAEGPLDAFVSGVYAGDADEISMRAAFPSVLEGERTHGSLVRWALSRLRPGKEEDDAEPARTPELFSFREGLQQWPEALADALGAERVLTSAPVRGIAPVDGGWTVDYERDGRREELRARQLVLAVPADVASALLSELEPGTARALSAIPYAPVAVVHLAYPRERVRHPLDGFGVLAPGREGRDVLGILWVSSLFDGRAPEGVALTAAFVGGSRRPELALEDDAALLERVEAEHRDLLGATGTPVFTHVHRWERAIPQYDMGHPARVRAVEETEERRPGLHLTGNYRSGVGIPATWSDGRRVAGEVLEALQPAALGPAGGPSRARRTRSPAMA